MVPHFEVSPSPSGTELRLLRGESTPLPVAAWALSGHLGPEICQRWIVDEQAIAEGDMLLVEHLPIARLSAGEAARLGLPPATQLRCVVEGQGVMMAPGFHMSLRWTRATGQNALGVERVGAWLHEPDGWRRLPETVFAIAEAVAAHEAAVTAGNEGGRMWALRDLLDHLPGAAGAATGRGLLGTVTIVEADALSLDATGEGDSLQLVPVLHRAGDDEAPLLSQERQAVFASQFRAFPTAHGVYALPSGVYVAIAPPLRQALEVVRRAAAGPPEQRRAFLREPRGAIAAAIGDEVDAALIEGLVRETPTWSERVIGLGLWQPRVLPWIALPTTDWFGNGAGAHLPRPGGLVIGDQRIPLTPNQAEELGQRVTTAIARGERSVALETEHGKVDVPASRETLECLAALRRGRAERAEKPPPPEVLLVKTNENAADIEAFVQQRPAPKPDASGGLRTALKAHQEEGLRWLQDNWIAGSPGVLLADDMGLGKTLQGLAFLAWLRHGMASGVISRAPLLIVAPTGLLATWQAEHDRHLAPPGLGTMLLAYRRDLAALRRAGSDGLPTLDVAAIRAADWVLTTYETLRDYDRAFGQVRFAAMLLDEAQKVKTPGIRLTDAAKAMNAAFRIALTGTPVENRLADLWCIVDGVAPGHLQTLRWFSKEYEEELNPEKLSRLKASLDRPLGARPPLLRRRLRADHLPDLPQAEEIVLRETMRDAQLAAYESAIDDARDEQRTGLVIMALQRLRAVSLHPDPEQAADDAALIEGSARLRLALATLDEVAERGEPALLFVESVAMMARLCGLLQRRYKLRNPPMTISGKVAGPVRQSRVDQFQGRPGGFDVMLLSPKAGGVGLTLTRANHVIHLERWWNPAVEDQCNGRVLRIGQTRPVRIYLPLAVLPGDRLSFDDNLHALLERKRSLMREALLPPEPAETELSDVLQASLK